MYLSTPISRGNSEMNEITFSLNRVRLLEVNELDLLTVVDLGVFVLKTIFFNVVII